MFRMGGSTGTGITSGLDQPRKQYANGTPNPYDMGAFSPGSTPGLLTGIGLDLLSRPPSGNIFQTAGAAAKEPFANFRNSRAAYNKGVQDRAVTKYNSQTGMFDTLLGAQAKILGSEGGSKMFAKQANDAEIQSIMGDLFQLKFARAVKRSPKVSESTTYTVIAWTTDISSPQQFHPEGFEQCTTATFRGDA